MPETGRMTAAAWDACRDPLRMLRYLERCKAPKASDRKLRLFAVACCRRVAHLLPDPQFGEIIDTLERYPDESVRPRAYFALQDKAFKILPLHTAVRLSAYHATVAVTGATNPAALGAASAAAAQAVFAFKRPPAEKVPQSRLLRDIVGNPFRPVAVEPAWRTSTVVALATAVYADRAFDRLPILADALQDAGCVSDDILSHCRDPKGVHARGCWVVDGILGKE